MFRVISLTARIGFICQSFPLLGTISVLTLRCPPERGNGQHKISLLQGRPGWMFLYCSLWFLTSNFTVGKFLWTMHHHYHHHQTVLTIFLVLPLIGLSLSMARDLPRVRFTKTPLSLRRENYRLLQRGSDVRR